MICGIPQWQRIVWSVRRCRVEGCQDRQTSPGRGRSLSLPTPGENQGSKSNKQTKRSAVFGRQLETADCVYPKHTLRIRFKKSACPPYPLPLLPPRWAEGQECQLDKGGRVFMQMWAEAKTAPGVALSVSPKISFSGRQYALASNHAHYWLTPNYGGFSD